MDDLLSAEDKALLWSPAVPDEREIDGVPVHFAPMAAGDALIFYGPALHRAAA